MTAPPQVRQAAAMRIAWTLLACALGAAARGEPPDAGALQVMAYNVMFDAATPDKSIDLIEREDPDVLCLTELTPGFAKRFNDRLGARYPHRSFEPRSGTWGVGMASKRPLSSAKVYLQKPHRMPALEAQLGGAEGPLTVACLHLFPSGAKQRKADGLFQTMHKNAALRTQQARAILARYPAEKGPVLLLGDMNEGVDGGAMAAFAGADFQRACDLATSKCGPTYPGATSALPAIWQVDHILGRGVTFESARVVRAGGSDHFPVTARLKPPP